MSAPAYNGQEGQRDDLWSWRHYLISEINFLTKLSHKIWEVRSVHDERVNMSAPAQHIMFRRLRGRRPPWSGRHFCISDTNFFKKLSYKLGKFSGFPSGSTSVLIVLSRVTVNPNHNTSLFMLLVLSISLYLSFYSFLPVSDSLYLLSLLSTAFLSISVWSDLYIKVGLTNSLWSCQ